MDTQQDNQISNITSAAEQPLSVGKTLREAREQLGLSVNDVANRIKFATRQIEALEADDYAQLPEAAFVRGFVRSYARLLELDPVHLVSGLPSTHTNTSSVHEVKSVEIPMPSAFSTRRSNIILLAAGLVIALSVAIFMRMHDRAPEVAEPVTQTQTTVQPLELPNATTENATAQLPEQNQLAVSAPEPTVSPAPVTAPQQAVRAAPAQATPQQTVRTAPAPAPVRQQSALPKAVTAAPAPVSEQPKVKAEVDASEHALRLEFDEDSWAEVKDGSGKILTAKMHRAGSLLRITGKTPLSVTIGNAHAVRLFDNGKNIKLERYTTADVAHVELK